MDTTPLNAKDFNSNVDFLSQMDFDEELQGVKQRVQGQCVVVCKYYHGAEEVL